MVNRFLNVASIFYFNLSSPSGIATCAALHAIRRFRMLCMQFADSAGNIAAGALIQTNTLYYCIFWIFALF
jgi:hypothetical protein